MSASMRALPSNPTLAQIFTHVRTYARPLHSCWVATPTVQVGRVLHQYSQTPAPPGEARRSCVGRSTSPGNLSLPPTRCTSTNIDRVGCILPMMGEKVDSNHALSQERIHQIQTQYLTSLGLPSAVKATPISLRYSSPPSSSTSESIHEPPLCVRMPICPQHSRAVYALAAMTPAIQTRRKGRRIALWSSS